MSQSRLSLITEAAKAAGLTASQFARVFNHLPAGFLRLDDATRADIVRILMENEKSAARIEQLEGEVRTLASQLIACRDMESRAVAAEEWRDDLDALLVSLYQTALPRCLPNTIRRLIDLQLSDRRSKRFREQCDGTVDPVVVPAEASE